MFGTTYRYRRIFVQFFIAESKISDVLATGERDHIQNIKTITS